MTQCDAVAALAASKRRVGRDPASTEHLGERETALARLIAALKPGGWILLDDADSITMAPDPAVDPEKIRRFERGWAAVGRFGATTAVDPAYGRRLYGALCSHGLEDVGAAGRAGMLREGTPAARFYRLSNEQLRDRILAVGEVSAPEFAAWLALFDDPDFVWLSQLARAAWGRRPPEEQTIAAPIADP